MLREFNCEIYSRKLWVATSWEDVKDAFVPYADYSFDEHEKADGVTYPQIERKKNKKYGVLIVFNFDEGIGGSRIVEVIAHESLHAVSAIFNELDIRYECVNDEHAAYMLGWVASCCWKVVQKEVYKDAKA